MKGKNYEIHIFLGKGRITKNSKYPTDEIHAFLFYLRELKNTDYDSVKAENLINEIGIDQVEFSKVGKLDPLRVTEKHREPYENALAKGSSIVVYSDPILNSSS